MRRKTVENIFLSVIALVGVGLILASIFNFIPSAKTKTETTKIGVPFTSQAPYGIWTEPWQNACEEASIIMVDNFYQGDQLTKEKAHQEILNVFQLKEEQYGPSDDESMKTVADIINRANLQWKAEVIEQPTVEDLKKELDNNRPIIVPVYAKALSNPYYANETIDYHVIVLTGYDDSAGEFISNDPGTENGKNFRYAYGELYNAIHDYLDDTDYTKGARRVIFTKPSNLAN